MRSATSLPIAALAIAFSVAACAERVPAIRDPGPGTVRPGYSGSVPSPEAQGRLLAAVGRELPVGTAGVTEEGWTIVDFSVVPSDAAPGGKGPIVRIRKDKAYRDLFVPDDAAIDALVNAVKPGDVPR